MRILHLTVHMGGGIGRAIHNLTQKDGVHTHTVICLQMPEKDAFIRACRDCGVQVICEPAPIELLELLRMSDVYLLLYLRHVMLFFSHPHAALKHLNGQQNKKQIF